MNKLQNILLIAGIMLVASSCYEDQGNYDYSEWEEITINNLEEEYTKLYLTDRLTITPDVSSNLPGDMVYSWTYGNLLDTIATGLTLDTPVTWAPNGNHFIYFHAMNIETGYSEVQRFRLFVNTPFLNAWYVLKDDGQYSELDMYNNADHSKTTDVFKFVNGDDEKINGKGVKFQYIYQHYTLDEEQNDFVRTKTLFILAEEDIVGVDAALLSKNWDYGNMFNTEPEEMPGPGFIGIAVYSELLVNSGQVYTISANSKTNGKWGVKKEIDLAGTPYNVSKYVYNDFFTLQLVFDDLGSSFYEVTDYNAQMRKVADNPNTEMSATNNGKRLLYMGVNRPLFVGSAYAVMQDKTNPDLKMITRVQYNGMDINLRNDTLQADVDKAYSGEFFTMARPEQGLYFIADNALYYRNVSSKDGAESLEFEIPAGETASFIRCVEDNNYVVLGTQVGSAYKLRFFSKTTAGHINPQPDFVLPREGETAEGNARDVLFLKPNMSVFGVQSW